MFRIGIAMIIGGVVLAFWGVQEFRVSSGTQWEPRHVTVSDLEAQGQGDNAHIVLTDFVFDEDIVIETKEGSPEYLTVWVPAYPVTPRDKEMMMQEQPPPDLMARMQERKPRVLIKSQQMPTDAAIEAAGDERDLPGLITNRIESVSGEERSLLQSRYPQADMDHMLIVEHGRQPAGIFKTGGLVGGGIALALGGLGAMAMKFRGR